MSIAITRVEIRDEQDVVYARQRARRIADLLGFDRNDQTRISSAVSEIARNAYQYGNGGEVEFMLEGTAPSQVFAVTVRDRGPGIKDVQAILEGRYHSPTGMGMGIIGTRRQMDQFHINTEPGKGTEVYTGKTIPPSAPAVTPVVIRRIAEALAAAVAETPLEEVLVVNQELLRALDELRHLREEIEVTNRGVVVLYAELSQANEILQAEIAERKLAEAALRIGNEIINHMEEGVNIIRDADLSIVYTNPKFDALFGYQTGELIGKSAAVLNAPNDLTPQKHAIAIRAVAVENGLWTGEIRNIRKDGTVFWCLATVSPFNHPIHGKTWISVHQDIIERKQAEERDRRQINDMKQMYDAMLDREDRVQELKKEINALLAKLGQPAKFPGG